MLARADVAQRPEIAGGENRLQMRRPAGFAHRRDLVVERLPVAVEHMCAGDDDVDLARAVLDRVAISARRCFSGVSPAGKPVATDATGMPEPASALTAGPTMVG